MLLSAAVVAFALQIYKDSSDENLYSSIFALTAFIPTCFIIFHSRNNNVGQAFTGTAVFFIIAANSLVPLIGTLIGGNSLITSLLRPVEVYYHRLIFAAILLTAHIIAQSFFFKPLFKKSARLGTMLNSNSLLPDSLVWGLGIIGFVTHLIKHLSLPVEVVKTFDGFGFLLWAPFVLLLPPYSHSKNRRANFWWLLVFYSLQVGVSLAGNSRMAMIGPIAVVASGWLVALLMGIVTIDRKMVLRSITVGIAAFFIGQQLSDLSTAMLIERGGREDRSMAEQLSATFDRFLDKDLLERYRKEIDLENEYLSADDDWKENYLNSGFIDRFVQIRVDDNSLDRIHSFNDHVLADMKKISMDKVLALLPTPVLKIFNVDIDKTELNSYSTGDLIEVLSGRGLPGGFRTGSLPIHAYGVFGWKYPFVLVIAYCLIFAIFQGLVSKIESARESASSISTLALILSFKFFNDISLDGIGALFGMLLRGVWQTVIIYFFVIWLIKSVKKHLPFVSRVPNTITADK